MPRTVWYPGHMAKGRRQLEALASAVDLLIEVRDARAPRLTSSPMLSLFAGKIETLSVLSKADLADAKVTKEWTAYMKSEGLPAWPLDLRRGGAGMVRDALLKKKPSFRDLRVAVVGTPNVGKSMLINQLAGRRAALVGGCPGVPPGVSWFGCNGLMLVDSPGILYPHADARAHRMVSWIGSSRGQVIGSFEEHAKDCIGFLIMKNLWRGVEILWNVRPVGTSAEILEQVGRRLGRLSPGGIVDMESAGRAFLDAFANGRFGRMSFERPCDAPLWEAL